MDNRYNRHNRRKYNLKVHIVPVTKYRKQLLKDSIADDVKQKIFDIANAYGYEIIAIETDKDHIHFLLIYDTTDRVCDIVKIVKQETTYYLRHKYGSLLSNQYWKKNPHTVTHGIDHLLHLRSHLTPHLRRQLVQCHTACCKHLL